MKKKQKYSVTGEIEYNPYVLTMEFDYVYPDSKHEAKLRKLCKEYFAEMGSSGTDFNCRDISFYFPILETDAKSISNMKKFIKESDKIMKCISATVYKTTYEEITENIHLK